MDRPVTAVGLENLSLGPDSVQFNEPPVHLIADIQASITNAIAQLPSDVDAALVGVADRKGGWNAAFVAKSPDGSIGVQAWIGKSWGNDSALDYGVQVMKTFKWR